MSTQPSIKRVAVRAWGYWRRGILPVVVGVLAFAVGLIPIFVVMAFFPPNPITIPLVVGWFVLLAVTTVVVMVAYLDEKFNL